MNRPGLNLRAVLAVGLLTVTAAPALAQNYTMTPIAGVADALSPTGEVAYVTQSVTKNAAFDPSYFGSLDNYVFSYHLSAPSSGGSSQFLGTSSNLFSSPYGNMFLGPTSYGPYTGSTSTANGGSSTNSNVFSSAGAPSNSLGGPDFAITGINSSGAFVANTGDLGLYAADGSSPIPTSSLSTAIVNLETARAAEGAGLIDNNGTITNLGAGTLVAGINTGGAVAFSSGQQTYYNNGGGTNNITVEWVNHGPAAYLAAGSTTPTVLADLGYGGTSAGLNDLGQVTGGFNTTHYDYCSRSNYTSSFTCTTNNDTRAFRSGSNGTGVQVFGTANGVSSYGNAINNSGQVGGYITLASGQTEAFLTTAHGGLMVGLGAGGATDSTAVEFLNNTGQAIIDDSTTNTWYLYSAGYIAPLTSLGATAGDAVVGFNDAGQILFQDPQLLSPTSSFGSVSQMSGLSGAVADSGTSVYSQVASGQGNTTPDSTFFSDPTTSTDTVSTTDISGVGSASLTSPTVTQSQFNGSGVPEPASLGLLTLAAIGALGLRRRRSA